MINLLEEIQECDKLNGIPIEDLLKVFVGDRDNVSELYSLKSMQRECILVSNNETKKFTIFNCIDKYFEMDLPSYKQSSQGKCDYIWTDILDLDYEKLKPLRAIAKSQSVNMCQCRQCFIHALETYNASKINKR